MEISKNPPALKAFTLKEAQIRVSYLSLSEFCTALTVLQQSYKLRLATMCLPALEVCDDASSTAHVFPRPCPHFPVLNPH